MRETHSPKLYTSDEVGRKLSELVESGAAAYVQIDIGGGRIRRVTIEDALPLDTENVRVENLSIGEEPSTP